MWTDAYLHTMAASHYWHSISSILLLRKFTLHLAYNLIWRAWDWCMLVKSIVNNLQFSHFWHTIILVALNLILHAISNILYLNICILAYYGIQSLFTYYFQHTMIEEVYSLSCIQFNMERPMLTYKINCKYYAIKSLLTYSTMILVALILILHAI